MNLLIMHVVRPLLTQLSCPITLRCLAGCGLAALLLNGCVSSTVSSAVKNTRDVRLPEHQLADFLSTDCQNIWQLSGHSTETNPLYWLRSMDCALRLTPADARVRARDWVGNSWQHSFKRGILLANAKINPYERRRNLADVDAWSMDIPPQVRPLYQMWRDGQAYQVQLSEERSRYSKLQQSTDGELDTLRQQQQHLRSQLDLTTRKLENLTDIERQLSSRKPTSGYIQDSAHPNRDDSSDPAADDASGQHNAAPAPEGTTP